MLEEIARGYLNKEIAARLGVSTETVRTYLKIIYERLDVHSRTEAAVKFLHAEGRGSMAWAEGWPPVVADSAYTRETKRSGQADSPRAARLG